MKNIFIIGLCLVASTVYSQINSNLEISNTIGGESPFLDVSSSASVNNRKGLLFPRTDLTSFTFVTQTGNFLLFPTGYDGMVVYNTTSGTTPATGSGVGGQELEPGFYYFSNPGSTGSTANGEWLPLGGGGDSRTEVVNNTINETTTIINGVPVNVVRLPGATNGTSTEMDLGTSILSANAVAELRKAIIYDNAGRLLLTATSDYNPATNVFVTGDGMVNKLLPEATDYVVELYFVPAVTP